MLALLLPQNSDDDGRGVCGGVGLRLSFFRIDSARRRSHSSAIPDDRTRFKTLGGLQCTVLSLTVPTNVPRALVAVNASLSVRDRWSELEALVAAVVVPLFCLRVL